MDFPSLASLLLLSSALTLTACPGNSDDTESGTASASSTNDSSTGTASASSTDGTTTGVTTAATDDTGTPTSGSTSTTEPATTGTVTTEPGTASTTDASTTDASTTDASTTDASTTGETSGTTGGGGMLEDSCDAACETLLDCDPNAYPSMQACIDECLGAGSGDPTCDAAVADFNNCAASYTCDELTMAMDGVFGKCSDAFGAYMAACG